MQIEAEWLEMVHDILRTHVPEREVRAVGSRVRGDNAEFSDLDLVVMGDEAMPGDQRGDLVEAFDESDLPIRVDVIELASTAEDFRPHLFEHWELVQSAGAVSR